MNKILLASLILSGAMIVGCDDKTATPAPATPAPTAADKAQQQAADTAKAVTDKTAGATDQAKTAGADAAKTATDAGAGAMDAVTKELGGSPQEMIDKAMAFIKDKKLDDAQAILTKLDAVKGKLPAEWASKIDAVKTALTAAKGAGAMPAVPGMGK